MTTQPGGRGRLSEFQTSGDAEWGKVRFAVGVDLLAATVVAMIVVPQPIVRAAITGAGLPIMLFVGVLVAAIFAVLWVYLFGSLLTWGRTPGMYLVDLGLEFESKPTPGEAAGWALATMLATIPGLCGMRSLMDGSTGLAARWSGMATRSTD